MLSGQRKENIELMSHIDFGEGGSGIWGHTDANGIEYAVIGTRQSIRVLSLEDPANPVERLVIPGANNIWREARSWGNYIYVTTEGPDGITIIDATNALNLFNGNVGNLLYPIPLQIHSEPSIASTWIHWASSTSMVIM